MTTNKPEVVALGNDPRKMSEADLLPCPNCNHRAGRATKRAAKGLPFVGLWKVSCQRPECPLAMIYFHPVEWNRLPRIRQSEYAALQAERDHYKNAIKEVTARNFAERWRSTATDKELEQYLSSGISQLENEHRKQIEALQADRDQQYDMKVKTREQRDAVTSKLKALQAECEKLRKDAERYRSLLEAVLREIPHRKWERGNAPGHCHSVPGIWDKDNGALAGKECAWCKVWNEAVSAMVLPKGGDT